MDKQARPVTADRIHKVLRGLGCVTNSQASDCAEAVMAMLYGTETDGEIIDRIYLENHPEEDPDNAE